MKTVEKNPAPKDADIEFFLNNVSVRLPEGFISFYKESNGAYITSEDSLTQLWPLTELIQLNEDYGVDEFAPEFFLFGGDGGGTAYAVEKLTGEIFEMPFIGMCKEEAVFIAETFDDFLKLR